MLNFVLGRKGSGKTTYIHKKLGSLSEEGERTVLVVPKQFTFESDRSVLSLIGPRLASRVEVLSFSRLADVVFKSCRKISKPILKDSANAVFMSLALDSLEEKLVFFSRHRSSVEFVKKMLSEVARFKKEAVSPKELFDAAAALEDGFLKKKTYETALIYETYNALVEESFFDDRDLLSAVFEILEESELFEGAVVAFDGFASFSGQEMKIIELLLKRAKDVYVTLCTDSLFETGALSPFAFTGKTGRRLFSLAKKIGVDVASPVVWTKTGPRLCLGRRRSAFLKKIFSILFREHSAKRRMKLKSTVLRRFAKSAPSLPRKFTRFCAARAIVAVTLPLFSEAARSIKRKCDIIFQNSACRFLRTGARAFKTNRFVFLSGRFLKFFQTDSLSKA